MQGATTDRVFLLFAAQGATATPHFPNTSPLVLQTQVTHTHTHLSTRTHAHTRR
jgi:hypothetical protein